MKHAMLSVLLMLGNAACGAIGYACSDSEQCVRGGQRGVCQPNGGCSFPDGTCGSGQRYGASPQGGLAGRCVPVVDDAGSSSGGLESSGTVGSEDGQTPGAETSVSLEMTSSGAQTSGADSTRGDRSETGDSSTGSPLSGPECETYCAAKQVCGLDDGGCIEACQSGIEYAFSIGEACGQALETLRACRSFQGCGDLQASFYDPVDSDCGLQYAAVGQACADARCVNFCGALDACTGGLPPPPGSDEPPLTCLVECSARTLDAHLEGGRTPCGEASANLTSCLASLDCESLLILMWEGDYGACWSEAESVIDGCPETVPGADPL